jgi:hypothetical protein
MLSRSRNISSPLIRPDANARSLRRLSGGYVSLFRIRADFNGIVLSGLLLHTRIVRLKAAIVIANEA